ncbi:microcystinase C [Mycolicibacterium litorale]|uniref:Microcystinase C n=1 Tax=Mycolicibacterium litorale TaxID=758802 RepID=A0A6S6NYY2_9MYCO|nr:M81 family metallopeptidase [Mycolicibacterium litorale]BCI51032.1 microcystinase C [Mycolicibacterium litorale]
MRVLLTEFRQESNSFSPVTSDLRYWRANGWTLTPAELYPKHTSGFTALGGMITVLEQSAGPDLEMVFGPGFYAQSGGPVTPEVVEEYLTQLTSALDEAGSLDAVLVSFHGALQSTVSDDVESDILRKVRDRVGPNCLVGVSTDLHGFITPTLIEQVDVLCGYQTYPHVDVVETGSRAATLVLSLYRGAPLYSAYAAIPMMVPAAAYTTGVGPFGDLISHAHALVADGTLEDFSVYQIQPWLDVERPNSAVVVYSKSPEHAEAAAAELATRLYAMRHDLEADLHSVEEIAARAASSESSKPVILVDSADSSNAGAPGDSATVLGVLAGSFPDLRAATIIVDSPAVEAAFAAGVGATQTFTLGGTIDPRAVPVTVEGRVRSLHDGGFDVEGQGSAGKHIELGRAAVLRVGHVDVLVCHTISGNGDPQLYRAFGIDQKMYDLVVVKANTSFRAGYEPFAGEIYLADTPGAAASDIRNLPFTKSHLHAFPWVDRADFAPEVVLHKLGG